MLIPLSIKQIPIDVAKVSEGMYVSKLDRPWLETLLMVRGAGGISEKRASSGWSHWAAAAD